MGWSLPYPKHPPSPPQQEVLKLSDPEEALPHGGVTNFWLVVELPLFDYTHCMNLC